MAMSVRVQIPTAFLLPSVHRNPVSAIWNTTVPIFWNPFDKLLHEDPVREKTPLPIRIREQESGGTAVR